jgi:hypothetical protein
MNALKRAGTGVLSFLLLISLSVFGSMFLIHNTLLDPDFVTAQVDKVDMTALAHDLADDLISERLPQEAEFLKEAIYEVIADQEPWLKEQLRNAVSPSYNFLLGKSDRLEINIPLDELKVNVRDSLWQTLQTFLAHNASSIPQGLLMPYIDEHYEEIIPLIPPQYLPPGMVGLTGQELKHYLDTHYDEVTDTLQTAFLLPGISGLILEKIQPYFDRYYSDFVADFPGTQSITENDIPADTMDDLQLARKSIGYFYIGYYALMAFMILLVAGIILINRNIKEITRALGIVFLIFGVAEFAGALFLRYFDFIRFIPDLPSSLRDWLPGVIKDSLLPLQWFSLCILILGAALIAVFIVYKPRKVQEG